MNNKNVCILKNIGKFSDIKIASGINLKNYEFCGRKNFKKFSGVSILKYGNKWFKLPNGLALFKTYDGDYLPELKNIRIINELICQKLAAQVCMTHAIYEPAYINLDVGLVSYNFLQENQKLMTLAQFLMVDDQLENNLIDIKSALDIYSKVGYDINHEQFLMDIYKIMVFDALTLQTDRNNFNINVIFDQNNLEIKVAPLFDNEFAFNGENLFNIENKNATIQQILANYSKQSKYLNVQSQMAGNETTYYKNIIDLCNLAKSNVKMGSFLKKCILDLNIDSAIQNVEQMGFEINQEYKDYLKHILFSTQKIFALELKKAPTEETRYLYDEMLK